MRKETFAVFNDQAMSNALVRVQLAPCERKANDEPKRSQSEKLKQSFAREREFAPVINVPRVHRGEVVLRRNCTPCET